MRVRNPHLSLAFPIGSSGQTLIVSGSVIQHFSLHQQKRADGKEAGGQLFARFSGNIVSLEKATGPRRSDFRARTRYVPDAEAEQAEIDRFHKIGLHYIGDWHTHPEYLPLPSNDDLESIRQSFVKSRHHLNGFVLAIIGNGPLPHSIYLSINDSKSEVVLSGRSNGLRSTQLR